MERVECVVVGAGIVGLACARALAQHGHEVIVLERADMIGTQTSARNSEIIHAGIYYDSDSAKARHCRAGRDLLYAYCESHGVEHRRCGKLIVASDTGQLDDLDRIALKAAANGVDDLARLSAEEARALEPEVGCAGALLSPSTGLVDSHSLMHAYLGDAQSDGAMLALNAPVESGEIASDGFVLHVGGDHPMTLGARRLVNAAGLWAQPLARSLTGLDPDTIPERHFARGVYFTLSGRQPFSRPIYPVPEPGGLGCHYTIDLAGQGKFGPDVEWIDEIDYTVDPARAGRFADAIRRYWPGLRDDALQPGYAGVRPKLHPAGGPATDFLIQGPEAHGVAGLVNLYGIESPGLTSSLSIAGEVAALIG